MGEHGDAEVPDAEADQADDHRGAPGGVGCCARDVEELWERGDEDGARNVNETFIQDVAVEIMLREDPLHFWWREQLNREDLWEEPWLPPDPVPGKAKREEGS
jgi:hypothetical protein